VPDERRVAGVDALRGVGFLSVFAFHSVLAFNIGGNGWLGDVYSNPFAYFVPNHLGTFGVTLFFVISGFCIHRSTVAWRARNPQATAGTMWRAYGARRMRRVYPLYLVTLVAFWVAAPRATVADLLLHAGLVQTLVPGHLNTINPSFWSLAVEAQLYALYPLLWAAIERFGARWALGAAAGLSLAWSIGAPALFHDAWWVSLPWRWGFPWVLGAAVAAAGDRLVAPRSLQLVVAGLIAVVLLAPSRSAMLYALVPALFFAALLAWSVSSERPLEAKRPLRWIGGVSYALYLIHQPLLDWAANALAAQQVRTVDPLPFLLGSMGMLALCLVVAAGMERVVANKVAPGVARVPLRA